LSWLEAGPSCPTSGRPSVDAGPERALACAILAYYNPQPLGIAGGRCIGQPGTAQAAVAAAGEDLAHLDLHGPHDLRHTFATWLEDAGIPRG
jgi:integrase